MKFIHPPIAATLVAVACLNAPAFAQEWQGHRAAVAAQETLHLDERYHHDHYYPPRGAFVPTVPVGSVSVAFGGGRYYYHGGVWFQPVGARFVVAMPPVGIALPLLPPSYVTLSIGGAPYYYANGVYYAPAAGQGYVVVAPPPGADAAVPVAAAAVLEPLPEPIVYPRAGQTSAQIAADRQACRTWAATQPYASTDAHVFHRAVTACMDGRGYVMR